MKIATCLMCGARFVQYSPRDHVCSFCEKVADAMDERESKKFQDAPPATTAGDSKRPDYGKAES